MSTTKTVWVLLAFFLVGSAPGATSAQERLADSEAIRLLYDKFFESFRQGGAQGAAGYLRQSGSIAEEVLRTLEQRALTVERNPFVGRPDSYVVVTETEIPRASRYRTVYALTYHDSRPVAWRLRFYKKVTGVWVFTDVQWEVEFVEDFLRLPELQFVGYRRIVERPPIREEEERRRR